MSFGGLSILNVVMDKLSASGGPNYDPKHDITKEDWEKLLKERESAEPKYDPKHDVVKVEWEKLLKEREGNMTLPAGNYPFFYNSHIVIFLKILKQNQPTCYNI